MDPAERHPGQESEGAIRPGVLVAGRYLVHERVGKGGMAEVFRAHDTKLDREIALKALLPDDDDPAGARRMMKEARAAAVFHHPGSVTVFDAGEHEGAPYIAMELVRGRPMSAFVRDRDVPAPRRIRWLAGVARALAAAHAAGLVHRDVKPSNVMIRDDGEPKVLDFGIAQRSAPVADTGNTGRLTPPGALVGTPGYTAPELILGEAATDRSDQFSWGVTAYEVLAGKRPYSGGDVGALIARMLCEPPPPLGAAAPDLPPEVAAVVERTLARSPGDRFASLDEVADLLLPYSEPAPARIAGVSKAPPPPPSGPVTPVDAPTRREHRSPRAVAPAPPEPTPRAVATPARQEVAAVSPARRSWMALGALAAVLVGVAAGIGTFASARHPPAPAAAAVQPVSALGCAPAVMSGGLPGSPDAEVARAIGIAGCARLAVELGVPWGEDKPSHTLEVRADLSAGQARVTLTVAGEGASASAPTPIQAIEAAVDELRGKVPVVPLPESEIRAWGAKDEAGARRIARAFRRRDLRLSRDIGAEVVRLQETDPESPFSYALPLMVVAGSREMIATARERTLARLDRLPPSRAHCLQGMLFLFPSVTDQEEGVRLLRQSYAEAPDDADMVGLYSSLAIRLGLPEAYSVFDRLVDKAPQRCVATFDQALIYAAESDPARNARYVQRLIQAYPEARASIVPVRHFLQTGKLEEAERAVALGELLGLTEAHRIAAIEVALASGRTDRARELARAQLGASAPFTNLQGAEVLVTSLFREGRAEECLTTLAGLETLGVDGGWAGGAARLVARDLAARRWLGRPGAPPAMLDWLARAADARTDLTGAARAEARVQLALANPTSKAERTALLADIEAEARAAETPFARDDLLAVSVPLVRAVRGDRAAISVWAAAGPAKIAMKIRAAIDAGLAFEKAHDMEGAARAYATALDPAALRESGIERVIATIRLARVHEHLGRTAEAEKMRAERAILEKTADPGLIAAIEKME